MFAVAARSNLSQNGWDPGERLQAEIRLKGLEPARWRQDQEALRTSALPSGSPHLDSGLGDAPGPEKKTARRRYRSDLGDRIIQGEGSIALGKVARASVFVRPP